MEVLKQVDGHRSGNADALPTLSGPILRAPHVDDAAIWNLVAALRAAGIELVEVCRAPDETNPNSL